jgi:hypothetical protein
MAATPGQQIQDRCHRDVMWHYFLCRPDREAGAKTRGSAAELAAQESTS